MIDFNLPKERKYKILKTAYFRAIYDESFKMTNRDFLFCTIKDIESNETIIRMFIEPKICYYIVKEPKKYKYPKIIVNLDEVEKRECLYRERDKSILKDLGLWGEAYSIKKYDFNAYREYVNQNVKNSPYLYSSDTNIEDYYKTEFELQYGSYEKCPLNKSYFDIEVDISEYEATENDPQSPISAISYYVESINTMYGLMLVYPDNKLQKEVMDNLKKFVVENLSNTEIKDTDINFDLRFYDDETDLIRDFFNIFHTVKADTLMAWNSPFDTKYILNRSKLLGIDVPRLVCSPEIQDEFKRIYYWADPERESKGVKVFHRLWDWVDMANYTMIIDQMSLYSNLRKRYQLSSYSLYNVSKVELEYTKVDLSSYGLTIRNAHILNYPVFLKYSITDTYLLYLLEKKSSDLNMFIANCDNTRISKGVNISIIIKNILYLEGLRNGQILGNSINYETWNSVPGAIVASPDNIMIKNATVAGEKNTLVFDNCIDMDASAEYPSIIREWNICKNTIKKRFTTITREGNPEHIKISGEDLFKGLETIESSLLDISSITFELPNIIDIIDMYDKR